MEAPEKGETAEAVARYFQRKSTKASAHYNVDNNSIVQCVRDIDIAWGAPGANHNGLHIEHAGYARQSSAEWDDPYSRDMLRLSTNLCADLCRKYGIPPVWLSPADLRAGKEGITSHHNVSLAFGKSSHTDPGQAFPHAKYVQMVADILSPRMSEEDTQTGMSLLRGLYALPLPQSAREKLNSLRDDPCWPPRAK